MPDPASSILPGPSPLVPWIDATFPGPRALTPRRSPKAQFTLPAQEALVGCLRRIAADLLSRWRLSDDERDAAVLIVGELAANAALHGRSEMSLCLILGPGTLRIAVGDHGDPTPSREPCATDDPDEHGRGLTLVHALSARVDLHHDDHGTWVLACLAVTGAHPRAD
ncbi:ATP-binding protein [Streptomyces sp. RPA4-5]|uniref:ATP-binding protein n=1 Tax=Streptomyces TaxID=1883 RepID=UPI00143E8C68|nr:MULTISPECIES: ATP-binding protein [Streptomyces]MCX4640420.1 ATP-binding protein [Streptomyces platensis]QIY53243.1 ATP-binding protein [Streptomyces sp. RPA4-5]